MRKISWLVVVSLMVCAVAAAQGVRRASSTRRLLAQGHKQAMPLRARQEFDREEARRRAEEVHAWLMSERVAKGLESPLEVTLSAAELEEIEVGAGESYAAQPARRVVGVNKGVLVEFAGDDVRWGAMEKTDDGGRVWTAAVRSANAYGLRLHFNLFWLPEDAELYVFNDSGEAFGPYTGTGPHDTGEFWSQLVTGEEIFVQLRIRGKAGNRTLRNTYFDVVGVGHVGTRFGAKINQSFAKDFCSYNEPCVENVECVNANSAVNDARNAVAQIQFVDGSRVYACSGGLVNNTSNDGTPYFLTANHCLSSDSVASTLEAFFQWSVPCGETCPAEGMDPIGVPRTIGATVVRSSPIGDYTLLELSQPAPAGSTFLGWTTESVAFSNRAMLYRISHPSSAPQAYSSHRVDTKAIQCGSWPRGQRIYSRNVVGATEGGSSGSPVVNRDGQLVGQLSGVCGYNPLDTCDSSMNATVDGAFASYFDDVAPWLDPPPGGCFDVDGDGHEAASCGGDDCDDSNALVYPGAEEACNNDVDDNCNGLVDEGCLVCDVDGDGFDSFDCGGADCDDLDPNSYPGASEICGDGVDNNCDGQADENCTECDVDGDGFMAELAECAGNDCDDSDSSVNPGVAEICENLLDDDCDGAVDGDDSDCATCAEKMQPCENDAECCSGICHPKQKRCK
jgi:V8-like Glu-specific endopeptidase